MRILKLLIGILLVLSNVALATTLIDPPRDALLYCSFDFVNRSVDIKNVTNYGQPDNPIPMADGVFTGQILVDGVLNDAAQFDGLSSEINFNHSTRLNNLNNRNLTYSFWGNISSTINPNFFLISKQTPSVAGNGTAAGPGMIINTIGLQSKSILPIFGQWVYYTITMNNTNITYYINGLANKSFTDTNPIPSINVNLTIGNTPVGSNFFQGQLDEIAYFNRTLSVDEIRALYYFGLGRNPYKNTTILINKTDALEGLPQTFNITIRTNDNVNTTATFAYGGVSRSLYKARYSFFDMYSATFNIPLSDQIVGQNKTGVWNYTIIGTGENDSEQMTFNQTINRRILTNCSNYSNVITINISYIDEDTNGQINATIETTFTIWNQDSSSYRTNLIDFDGLRLNHSICIYPATAAYNASYEIIAHRTGYQQQILTKQDQILTNISQNINVYMLATALGIYARFRAVDDYENIITGVSVVVSKNIGGTDVIVATSVTDASGIVTFFLNPDDEYSFLFTKTGYLTENFNVRPTSTDIYNVIMGQETSSIGLSDYYGSVYSFYPGTNLIDNDTIYRFGFNVTASNRNITYCYLRLYIDNITGTIINTTTGIINNTDCRLNFNVFTYNYTRFVAQGLYEINNTFNTTVYFYYKIQDNYIGEFSIKVFLDDIRNFSRAGFNDFSRVMLDFLAITLIVYFISQQVQIINPDGILIIIWILVFLFSIAGFFTIELLTLPGLPGLDQYFILILTTLATIGIITIRHI